MKKVSTAHIMLLLILVLQILLSVIIAVGNIELPMGVALWLGQAIILLPFVIYCIIKKQNPLKLIQLKKIKFREVLFSVLIAVFSYPVVVFLNFVSMLFVENAMADVMTETLSMGLLTGIIFMAVVPAIVEETIFRGVVYNSYRKRRPIVGIFLSALLFGLMHGNFNQMPYACFLGIVMAFLMEACDSILAPMILHFTLNASSALISWFSADSMQGTDLGASTDLKSMLLESYKISFEQMGVEIAEEQLVSMMPAIIAFLIIFYAIIAVFAGVIIFVLIYAIFRMNHKTLSDVFKADFSETAYVEKRNGKLRKNRIIDVYVILFIMGTVAICVLNTI